MVLHIQTNGLLHPLTLNLTEMLALTPSTTLPSWVKAHPSLTMGSALVTLNWQLSNTVGTLASIFQPLNSLIHQISSTLLPKWDKQKPTQSTALLFNHNLDGTTTTPSRTPSRTPPSSANMLIPPCFARHVHHLVLHAMFLVGMNPCH